MLATERIRCVTDRVVDTLVKSTILCLVKQMIVLMQTVTLTIGSRQPAQGGLSTATMTRFPAVRSTRERKKTAPMF
jgi:hypothetical protein